MNPLLVLATALRIGTLPVAGATGYDWEVFYPQINQSEIYTTVEPVLEFNARPGRLSRWRTRVTPSGPWSAWSYDVIADPLPGDSTLDCRVSTLDYLEFRSNYGTACP